MNFNLILKDAIAKGSGRVVRKSVATVRQDVAVLKRQVAELRRIVRILQRGTAKSVVELPVETSDSDSKRLRRPTADHVKQLRRKLGLTQVEMARLLGISSLTISKWECGSGLLTMRKRTLLAFQQARGLGKREARERVAAG